MTRAYVSVGSNVDPERHVEAALHALGRVVEIVASSTFYRTEPVGHPRAPQFVNGVWAIETEVPAARLKWDVLRHIEADLGRRRGRDRNAPRTIDLDLVLYGDEICRTPRLTVPDPEIERRPFLAWPLVELDPTLVVPGGRPLRATAERLSRASMIALPELTARLRAGLAADRAGWRARYGRNGHGLPELPRR